MGMKRLIQIVRQQKSSAVQAFQNQGKETEKLSGPFRFLFVRYCKSGMSGTAVGEKEGSLRKARFLTIGVVQYIKIHCLQKTAQPFFFFVCFRQLRKHPDPV